MAEWTDRFKELTDSTHTEQAIWWLNGYWAEGADGYAEDIWKITHHFIEMDLGRPLLYGGKMAEYKEGCDLDEMKSHRIMEALGETCTVLELRKRLKKLDIDNNKRMALSEYLLDRYNKTPLELVKAPQGDVDPAELAAAIKACDEAGAALDQAAADAEAAHAAVLASNLAAGAAATAKDEADAAAAAAAESLQAAEAAEAKVRAAEAELQSAIDEIEGLEKAKQDKIDKCNKIIDDPSTGIVKKGRAVQERDATLAEDPMPLRKAKLTQKASLRKVAKARAVAEEETAKSAAAKQAADDAAVAAASAKQAAEEAAAASVAAKEQADKAKAEAEESVKSAEATLELLKSKGGGSPQGKLWWMSRVMTEKKKYMR